MPKSIFIIRVFASVIFLFFRIFGQERELFESKYDNGQLEWRRYIALDSQKNRVTDGIYTAWYRNGQKMVESSYKLGNNDGLSKIWYESGKVKEIDSFGVEGLISILQWNEKGSKMRSLRNKNKRNEDTSWFESGEILSISLTDSNGNYTYNQWFKNGQLIESKQSDSSGKIKCKGWYITGKKRMECTLTNRMRVDAIYWDELGNIIKDFPKH